MHLYLTGLSHLNSAYVDDSGQVLYKTSTPNKFFHRVTTIKRVLPGNLHSSSEASTSYRRSSDEATTDNESDIESDEPDEHVDEDDDTVIQEPEGGGNEFRFGDFGDFGHLAEITFKPIAPSVLRFGGQEHESTQLFTKKARGRYGRSRAFTGPDGIEYQWIMKRMASKLVRVDPEGGSTTPVAQFNRRHYGIFMKPRQASLEIFSEGMHMVDLIFITFVYVQKLRHDKKKSAHEN